MTMTTSARLGRLLILLAATLLLIDGVLQLTSPPSMIAALEHIGYPAKAGPSLSLLTIACALFLAVPMTSLVGAVLTTGFLGGAIAVHVPASGLGSPPQLVCLALGFLVWGGLFLADRRLPALLGFGTATPE